MAIKLHRCRFQFLKLEGHPCWRVEKALLDQGIAYDRVVADRDTVEGGTGQRKLPAIEREDGTWYREESKEMARRIREGRLN
jgi:hypothetical protein